MASTIKDIARETGLSLATISKYLNGGSLREKNRQAIEQAIRKLDYHVNEYARGLKSNRSRTVGVVIPELSNLFITQIISVMEGVLQEKGYSVMVCDCRSDPERECRAVRFLLEKRVDGLINMPIGAGAHLGPALEEELPVLLLDRPLPLLAGRVSCVLSDNEGAARTAARRLLEAGHRQIGIIVGPTDIFTSQLRLKGYREALEEYGVAPCENLIAYSDYTVQGGYRQICRLLEENRDDDGRVCDELRDDARRADCAERARRAHPGGALDHRLRQPRSLARGEPAAHHREPAARGDRAAGGAAHAGSAFGREPHAAHPDAFHLHPGGQKRAPAHAVRCRRQKGKRSFKQTKRSSPRRAESSSFSAPPRPKGRSGAYFTSMVTACGRRLSADTVTVAAPGSSRLRMVSSIRPWCARRTGDWQSVGS